MLLLPGKTEEDPAVTKCDISLPISYLEMFFLHVRIVWSHRRPAPSLMDITSSPLPVFSLDLPG